MIKFQICMSNLSPPCRHSFWCRRKAKGNLCKHELQLNTYLSNCTRLHTLHSLCSLFTVSTTTTCYNTAYRVGKLLTTKIRILDQHIQNNSYFNDFPNEGFQKMSIFGQELFYNFDVNCNSALENRYIAVNLCPMPLCHTLCNPHNVTVLLLL